MDEFYNFFKNSEEKEVITVISILIGVVGGPSTGGIR